MTGANSISIITLFCYTIINYNVCGRSFPQEATYEIGTS